jgi:hypothetical protein
MGYWGKKISFFSYLLFRFAIFIMAIAIAYLCFFGGGSLKLIKFPLIGGEIQFEKKEKLPEGTIKVTLNEAKYVFDNNFILRVRPRQRATQDDNSFNVSFYKFSESIPINDREYSKSTDFMTPGDILSVKVDDLWYYVRMLKIKKDNGNVDCYFNIYTSNEEVHR